MINPVLSVDTDWVKNYYQFNSLFNFVIKRFKECEQIIFIDCHQNIINFLNSNDNFIINIDHHHDISQPKIPASKDYIHVGNWVEYLISKNRLDKFIWVNNPDSFVEEDQLDPIRNIQSFKICSNLNEISNFLYKKIVICKSFDYFTEVEKNMGLSNIFNLLQIVAINLYKEKIIIDNQSNPYNFKLK